jgi:oligopeptide/dipeptide ABC transporter ATP-binding protein
MLAEAMLKVVNLRTYFFSRFKPALRAVDGISYEVRQGEMVAVAGESGCGKSMSILSLVRLNPPSSTIVGGEVWWGAQDLMQTSTEQMYHIRGSEIGMIFQNPLSSLNPLMTIGRQLSEAFQIHQRLSRKESWEESQRMLERVAVPDVMSKMEAYPFQLSGGMRQRVMIAMALCCGPKLLIADEPTTALDATTQAQILELIASANREAGRATILVTHDLGIVARYADRVHVMYAGHIVETADCADLYSKPLHPYTELLLKAVPRLDRSDDYKLVPIQGYPPRMDRLGPGCSFEPRCPRRVARCRDQAPSLEGKPSDRAVACWQA